MTTHTAVSWAAALRRETVRKFRQVGLWGTLKHGAVKLVRDTRGLVAPRRVASDPFDDIYGTDTGGVLGVGSLDIPEEQMEHAIGYGPISEEEFDRLMKEIPVSGEALVFVDLGSGKGRALLLASRFPFRRIVGVELSRMLHVTAVDNIRTFKDRRQVCHEIQSVCANASTYHLPVEPLLIYLHNPFGDAVMREVVAHIEASLRAAPRPIYIWYIKPDFRSAWDASPCLRVLKDTGRYVFYEAVPA